MLNILGMIILIIILFIIILLLVGIRISLEYEKTGSKLKGCLKILIFKKIKVFSRKFPSEDKDTNKDKEDKNEDKEKDRRKLFNLAKPCFGDFKEYLESALDMVNISRCENHLIFGMASCADTAKHIGFIWAVLAMVNPMHEKLNLTAEPYFSGSILDGWGKNEIEIHVLKMAVPTIRLISKKHVRTFIRGVLDERKN